MSTVIIILKQVIIMFILAFVGYVMYRFRKISNEGSKSIGNILIWLSLPCVIINSFLVDRSPEKFRALFLSALLAFLIVLISIIVSRICLGKNAIDNFASSFSNPGFFGVPIIAASLSDEAVFYVAAYIAFLNLGQWTYGVWLLNNSDENGILLTKSERKAAAETNQTESNAAAMVKKLFTAPFMVAILVGLFFFFTGLRLPSIVSKSINFIAGLNTPLAMFTIGIYLAQTDIAKMFAKVSLYKVAFVRMLLVPAISALLLTLVPASMMQMKLALLITAACPVGSNVAVYAQLHDRDYSYAVETVIISTMISIVTIPVIVGTVGALWA